ncbi:MAG: hypothetical protein ATN33_05135 [Epulopiscium sp. Nele67-Bin001]|nr:MAG: hypothetical protein BEN18_03150 [Epulopiscium sp. Nuni2H_MBin001]OON93856.1 MAG: hypothetical protein ATN33_05135 [Epulopiscium sp. Nele67-Bin001]
MNLALTDEEFKTLIDLVYVGNFVINGMRDSQDKIKSPFALEQKIFSLANSEVAKYDKEFNEYMPTAQYEASKVGEWIDAYDDRVFFEELVVRLARRDALNKLGDEDPEMTQTKLDETQLQFEEIYDEELEYHGLTRFKIVPIEPAH